MAPRIYVVMWQTPLLRRHQCGLQQTHEAWITHASLLNMAVHTSATFVYARVTENMCSFKSMCACTCVHVIHTICFL